MQLSRLRPLNLSSFIFLLQIRRSLRLSVCAFCIRVEALYTLKHHPAESVTSDFFIADPIYTEITNAVHVTSLPGSLYVCLHFANAHEEHGAVSSTGPYS